MIINKHLISSWHIFYSSCSLYWRFVLFTEIMMNNSLLKGSPKTGLEPTISSFVGKRSTIKSLGYNKIQKKVNRNRRKKVYFVKIKILYRIK